jgi:hypothetical protein
MANTPHRFPHFLDVGARIIAPEIIDHARAVRDISTATTIELLATRPSGASTTWTAVLDGDGTDGLVAYLTQADDLDEVGLWSIQAHVILADGSEFHGPAGRMPVEPTLEGGAGTGTGISSHAERHYADGADPMLVVRLSSDAEPAGRFLEADGAGGLRWTSVLQIGAGDFAPIVVDDGDVITDDDEVVWDG